MNNYDPLSFDRGGRRTGRVLRRGGGGADGCKDASGGAIRHAGRRDDGRRSALPHVLCRRWTPGDRRGGLGTDRAVAARRLGARPGRTSLWLRRSGYRHDCLRNGRHGAGSGRCVAAPLQIVRSSRAGRANPGSAVCRAGRADFPKGGRMDRRYRRWFARVSGRGGL